MRASNKTFMQAWNTFYLGEQKNSYVGELVYEYLSKGRKNHFITLSEFYIMVDKLS